MLAFYLPYISVVMTEAILGVTQSVTLAYDVATAIVFINSSLNPIIYCWRIAQIRLAVRNILKNFIFSKNWCRLSSPLAARDVQLNQGITERGATVVITGYVYLEEHLSTEGRGAGGDREYKHWADHQQRSYFHLASLVSLRFRLGRGGSWGEKREAKKWESRESQGRKTPRFCFPLPLSLRASSIWRSGERAGKGRRTCNYVPGIWTSASKKSIRNADWRRWHY